MKNLKKLFLMSILAISVFVLCGMTNVKAAAFSLKNIDLICDPAKLDKGSRATCYIIGIPSETGDSVHGYVVRAYTTKYLKLIGAQTIITNTDQVWTDATSATATVTPKDTMPDEVKAVSCEYDSTGIGESVKATTYGCGIFYTRKNVESAFKQSVIKSPTEKSKVKAEIFPNDTYGVIGALIVELDENTTGNECGQICFKAWRVPTLAEYSNYAKCATDGTNPNTDCGPEKNVYDCEEIHYNGESGTFTETGAFASYALLAACALIAISAITLAKKNNKFSRI